MNPIPLSQILSGAAMGLNGGDPNSPYLLVGGKIQQNPGFQNQLQQGQFSQLVNGPTQQSMLGDAQKAALTALATQNAAEQKPFTPAELAGIVDKNTGLPAPSGLTQARFNQGGYRALSPTEEQSIPYMRAAQSIMSDLSQKVSKIQTGPVLGAKVALVQQAPMLSGLLSNDEANVVQRLNELTQTYQNMLDGKRVASGQSEQIKTLQFPTLYDNPERFKMKLANVERTINAVGQLPTDQQLLQTAQSAQMAQGTQSPQVMPQMPDATQYQQGQSGMGMPGQMSPQASPPGLSSGSQAGNPQMPGAGSRLPINAFLAQMQAQSNQ